MTLELVFGGASTVVTLKGGAISVLFDVVGFPLLCFCSSTTTNTLNRTSLPANRGRWMETGDEGMWKGRGKMFETEINIEIDRDKR